MKNKAKSKAKAKESAKPKLSRAEREKRAKAIKRRIDPKTGTLLSNDEMKRRKAAKKAAKTRAANENRAQRKPHPKKAGKAKAKKNPVQAPASPAPGPVGVVYEEENPMKKGKKGKAKKNPAGKGPAKSKGKGKGKSKKKIDITPGSPVNIKGQTKRKVDGKPMVLNTNIRLVMSKPQRAKPKSKPSGGKKKKGKGKKMSAEKRLALAVARDQKKALAAQIKRLQHEHRSMAAENPAAMILGAQENPASWGEFGVAGLVAALGFIAVDTLDRFIATKPTTDPSQQTNAPLAGKNPMVLAGPPGIGRILAQFGVFVAGGLGAGATYRSAHAPSSGMGVRLANAGFAGLAIGAIVHLGYQMWTHYVMAKLLAAKDLGQRLYPSEIAADQVISSAPPTGQQQGARYLAGVQGRAPYAAPRVVRGTGVAAAAANADGTPRTVEPTCGPCDQTGQQLVDIVKQGASQSGDCGCSNQPMGTSSGSMPTTGQQQGIGAPSQAEAQAQAEPVAVARQQPAKSIATFSGPKFPLSFVDDKAA